ncbi:pyridoxamine 5'-phosphate oxidase [Pseudorhodoplanes sp.]|jgi:pyridoxamine 5'-phosphate oxidase|uniref:pyridoxamine 5'-phosphate oxidase n=1 Tax=Pseudorhodoplanes sp. TaxID=1934341 RepID=UPI002BA51150|nr:pyridoxamine 5'-phosphate oxidase [Pseudorhodoplanes sp.]HWV40794.1 pyridoxamine 5'-phosphate oxidase [Pseudorhodoplanes sp.]
MTDTPSIQQPELLRNGDFTEAAEPFALFAAWLDEAQRSEPNDPNAMALATAGEDGFPDVRMVLLKGFDEAGFVFYTNLGSAKARELKERPEAALAFHWKSLRRQVRVRGTVTQVSDAEADAYFATRPRLAQIGAWASKQSSPLESRLAFEGAVAKVTARYPLGTIPRPPFWSGFRIAPLAMEFWHDRPFRLHDRIAFTRGQPDEAWVKTRLYP